jgi:hypothetical protein
MEKTIYQIAFTETVVFSCAEIDTLITFSGSGLRWWMSADNGEFMLVDTLDVNNDLSRAPIAYARKLASDWFNHSMTKAADGSTEEETPLSNAYNTTPVNRNYTPVRNVVKVEKNFPVVEPMWVDEDKRDAHTEHCCLTHRFCFYGNSKCSVVLGKKKPSYSCRCAEKEKAA